VKQGRRDAGTQGPREAEKQGSKEANTVGPATIFFTASLNMSQLFCVVPLRKNPFPAVQWTALPSLVAASLADTSRHQSLILVASCGDTDAATLASVELSVTACTQQNPDTTHRHQCAQSGLWSCKLTRGARPAACSRGCSNIDEFTVDCVHHSPCKTIDGRTHGRTDARTHGRTDARTHGRTDARTHPLRILRIVVECCA
jgi:hypothetical protein